MQIREATTADIDSLSSLAARTFLETYDDLTDAEANAYISEFFSSSVFAEHIRSPDRQVFVVEEERLIGYALLSVNEPPLSSSTGPSIECVRLFLDGAAQGRKLGMKLLNRALDWAGEKGFRACWLKVWDQNAGAIAFYERNGFARLGFVPYTEGGMNDRVLIMQRELGEENETGI